MNEEELNYPKTGLFANYLKFPRFGNFSFSMGLAKEPHQYCMDGYEKPITHTGYEIYFYVIVYNRQLTIGFRKVNEVSK